MIPMNDKAAERGCPSYSWRHGQERRLKLIEAVTPLEDKVILDVGCGIGTFVRRFRDFSSKVVGVDVESERIERGAKEIPNLLVAAAEELPFADGQFDLILLNEVIEHVRDDRAAIVDAVRVLRPGGYLVIFAPNRLYPLETHGVYLGKKFVYRLTPFVNWLPRRIRDRFVPHARAYLGKDLRRLIKGLPARTVEETYVYPGYDKIVNRRPTLGKFLRKATYALEKSPGRRFGLSHFFVVQKLAP